MGLFCEENDLGRRRLDVNKRLWMEELGLGYWSGGRKRGEGGKGRKGY